MDPDLLIAERAERDRFFATDYASPIPDEHLAGFTGIAYFPPDPSWEIVARYESADPHKIPIPSTSGAESPYTMLGVAVLDVDARTYRLAVLDDGDGGAFIPFRDGTSGTTTYGGGRYVPVAPSQDGGVTVDFNRAVNPYCVYDEEFVCPLPPATNWITTPVEAGEKMYQPPAT